ncbi:copper-binding protein [Thiobacter aerophilum]|uniref:Copper-binding protein n=1 Tax=Thiobacter aerophilum TaxID=3121275 RepID=A0ABV0EC00_9BURK
MKFPIFFASLVALGIALPVAAEPGMAHGDMPGGRHMAQGEAQSAIAGVGVVRQVKADQGKVRIDHEPIPALGWPAMNMFFRVKDKALLEGLAPGDKVRFQLEKDAAGLLITRIEKAGS